MIIQIVKLTTTLSEDELLATANERAEQYRAVPGLLQKYYIKLKQPDHYGGILVWDSRESLASFRGSELSATIPVAYKVAEPPNIEILDVLFQLQE